MVDPHFSQWLAHRSWVQAVRFSRIIAWLLPPAALAVHAPAWRDPALYQQAGWLSLLAWHLATECVCISVLVADRRFPQLRGRELPINAFCALVMVLCTWGGIAGWLTYRDFALYALGTTFVAAVLSTPRPVRRPMYVVSVLAVVLVVQQHAADLLQLLAIVTNPLSVALICNEIDKYVLDRNRALYAETQRAEAERARADAVLYNVLPGPVADELKRNHKVEAVKHEHMGVLFADIAGFTQFSRNLPADALVFILNQIFSMFDVLVERHGVEKIKTIGDAYMVVSAHDVRALAQLALDMFEAMERYNALNGTRLRMRIGLHAGPAVSGVIGLKRFLYDVWGDTVNIASRMESSGEPGTIHVTEAVYLQLREAFVFEPGGTVNVRGQGTMAGYLLMGSRQ